MLKLSAVVITVVILAGCTSTANVKLNKNNSSQFTGKSLSLTSSNKPDFSAMTAGKAMFGLIGAMAMVNKGNAIVRTNNIADPSVAISKTVAKALTNKYSLKTNYVSKPESNDNVSQLAKKYGSSDYILDVRTINWGFVYFPTDWNNYKVLYSSKLKLINTKTKSVVAEGFCSSDSSKTAGSQAPSYNQLMANNAAGLKSKLRSAEQYCSKLLIKKIL